MEAGVQAYDESTHSTDNNGYGTQMDGMGHEQGQQHKEEAACTDYQRVTATRIKELCESQGYRCALSGELLSPKTASLDHKTPISRGGENSIANCQIVHIEINRMKGLMTNEEFEARCTAVANHAARLVDPYCPN